MPRVPYMRAAQFQSFLKHSKIEFQADALFTRNKRKMLTLKNKK